MGGPGCGKSTLCNFLLEGKDSGKFKASKSTKTGETKTVSSQEGYALGDPSRCKVKIFDTPGLADPELPIEAWCDEIRDSIPED